MVRGASVGVLSLAAACAGDAAPRAALGEVCGVDEPLRVLALEPGEVLGSRPQLFADEMFYPVLDPHSDQQELQYGSYEAAYAELSLRASGPCGESPRPVTDGVSLTFTYDLWPDVLLGIDERDRSYVSIDPAGGPTQVLFPELGRWTSHGLVTLGDDDAGQAALRLYPYPEDPRDGAVEPAVLLDATSTPEHALDRRLAYSVVEDAAFILTVDDTLLAVELPGGAVTVEQTDVVDFEVSPDSRYLLWQDVRQTNEGGEWAEGAVFLRDRTTGVGVSLAQTNLRLSTFPLARVAHDIITLNQSDGHLRIYFLPALDFVDLPPTVEIASGPLADGRWLLQPWFGGVLYLSDLRDAATLTPFASGVLVSVEKDGALVLDVPTCCYPDVQFAVGPLWFVPFDGSPPRRVADRLSQRYRRLTDGRLLTAMNFDSYGVGDLMLVDPRSGEELLVDHGAVSFSNYWHTTDDVVRYPVADGARSGVWIARMPPRSEP